nr:1,2-phenylacetyl-CoA epoxidase subunit PaaE [Austwickia sp. TVS 96-490-7B]
MGRAHFYPLTVREVRRLTDDAVEVVLIVPPELVPVFDHHPGQYVAVRAEVGGTQVRRSYSLCGPPAVGEIRIAIKRDRGGVFSTWANETLQPGMTVEAMSPRGGFISRCGVGDGDDAEGLVAADKTSRYLAVAAGSGITPIVAIARGVLHRSPRAVFDLVFANRTANDVMFVEEIADLKDRYPARFAVHHVLSREQRSSPWHSGRIDDVKLRELFDVVVPVAEVDEFFLCGPFELVQLVRDDLARRGVPSEKVRYELFASASTARARTETGAPVAADPTGETTTIRFTLDGLTSEVESPRSARETLLNAALRVRADVPFACAGGVCGTCRARLVDGQVDMADNYALEPDEVADGFVLTCQSRATTESVTIDFDA